MRDSGVSSGCLVREKPLRLKEGRKWTISRSFVAEKGWRSLEEEVETNEVSPSLKRGFRCGG